MCERSTGIKPRVYAQFMFSLSVDENPRTVSPVTRLLSMKDFCEVIVDKFNFTGTVVTFSAETVSSCMKVVSLCVSSKAYINTSLEGSFADETQTGTIIDVHVLLTSLESLRLTLKDDLDGPTDYPHCLQ